MIVHFIGAGPGAPDLITMRGREILSRCPVCLYAGSLVHPDLLQFCPEGARIVDTAPMNLEEIVAEFEAAHAANQDVVRLHSGDLSIFSAIGEQLRELDRRNIPYTLTPGVPAFAAASAALRRELTLPEFSQSVVLTRTSGRASAMPPCETLAAFGATRATLGTILQEVAKEPPVRSALIIVGEALASEDFRASALYDANYHRRYRAGGQS